ncbi:hypothetical protein G6F23_015434 [Rhizopus arrhizus]|nr:hypothetical protein G6F23_015434 [Rhizopus arrhizus]
MPVLPDRRSQVRQAHPGPRAASRHLAGRGRQVRADLNGLHAALEHFGGPAAGPAGLRHERAARHALRQHRRAQRVFAEIPDPL